MKFNNENKHRVLKANTPKQLAYSRKVLTARHLRPVNMPKKKEPQVNSILQTKIANFLPGKEKGDMETARLFLLDMKKIYPDYVKYGEQIFLQAVIKCCRRRELTVDKVWETMQIVKNPNLDKIQIISTPMGGKPRK